MGAMEINNSGTTARDGLSGGVDRGDAIRVGILVRGLSSGLGLNAEQAADLRQCRQDALFRPCLDFLSRKLEQGSQVPIACDAKPRTQRALAHSGVDFKPNFSGRSPQVAGLHCGKTERGVSAW